MRALSMLLAAILTACATRAVPRTFPAGSAASPATQSAPAAEVTTALREHPPLPGEDEERWTGLAPKDPPRNEPPTTAHGAGKEHRHGH